MSNYNGVGYYGDTSSLDGDNSIQDFLSSEQIPVSGFLDIFQLTNQEGARITGSSYTALYAYAFNRDVYPTADLEDYITKYRAYLYGNFVTPAPASMGITSGMSPQEKMAKALQWLAVPSNGKTDELNYLWPPTGYVHTLGAALAGSLNPNTWVLPSTGGPGKPFSDFTAAEQATIAINLLNTAFKEFATKTLNPYPQDSTGQQKTASIRDSFAQFLTQFVAVTESQTQLSYENFYNAFFTAGISGAGGFDQFFSKFVQSVYGNVLTGTGGTDGYFLPSLQFDQFTKAVLDAYIIAIPGSSSLGPSGSDAGSSKTFIMNRIFSLLVLMIESLQRVAAAQSDRLQILSKWQAAYTDLQNNLLYAVEDDDRFSAVIKNSGNATRRGAFNDTNASYTETIKARNSVVGDDAKSLQTQINQSTDQVNQQASMATSIIQQLSSIFKSIYR